MSGRYCRLEPLMPTGMRARSTKRRATTRMAARWTYLVSRAVHGFRRVRPAGAAARRRLRDKLFFAIVDAATGRACGIRTLHAHRTRARRASRSATSISRRDSRARAPRPRRCTCSWRRPSRSGYRRYEWKCDSCNLPSRAAATRLGFTYEGLFRQAIVNKGRNRDTTWFAIIDTDWNGGLKDAYLRWLDPGEFRCAGRAKAQACPRSPRRSCTRLSPEGSGRAETHDVLRDQRGCGLQDPLVLVGQVDHLRARD